jgi:tetratricopeptide (TPR) repeat protein
VPEPFDPAARPGTPSAASGRAPDSPLVLIPLTAEDAARKSRRVKAVWILAAVIVLAGSAWMYKHSNDPVEAQQAFAAAQRLFDVARYEQVIVSCDRAIALKPDFAEAYLLRGKARVAHYDADLAAADFSKAIELRPRDPQVLLERASAYVDQKNYRAAIADATGALAIDSHLARAYNLRATALRATGDAQKAVADFTSAVKLQPDSDNYYQRGATYQILVDHHNAIEDFAEAIANDPDKPQAYFARAESERALGDMAAADRDQQQGRKLDGR